MTAHPFDQHSTLSSRRDSARHDLLAAIGLSLCLFAIYLTTYRGGFHSIDEVSMFAVTESLVKFGEVNTDQIAWTQWVTSQREAQGFFGLDGHVYSKKGLLLSLAMAPLYWLGLVTPGIGMLQAVSLTNLIVTAATGGLLYLTVRRLDFGRTVALATAGIYGLATIAWVYSKYLFSEPLAGLLLLGGTYLVIVFRRQGGRWRAVLAGTLTGLAVLARANNLFIVPVFALYVCLSPRAGLSCEETAGQDTPLAPRSYDVRHRGVRALRSGLCFAVGLLPPALMLTGYNWLRSGNPFQTGYDLTIFSPNVLDGLYKLLFSPLRGLFVYSPVLLLSLPGLVWLWRRRRAEVALISGTVAVVLVLFAAWTSGEGLSWGSRFLVPVVPLLGLSLAPVVERALANKVPLAILLGVLSCVSFGIQVLGAAMNPWVYLGHLQAEMGGEFFLERTVALVDFGYSQVVGQLRFWSLASSDVAWWQPWGFDALAVGLGVLLLVVAAANLVRLHLHAPPAHTGERLRTSRPAVDFVAVGATGVVAVVITLLLLRRYYVSDQQFGSPGDPYTAALDRMASQAGPNERVVTVAPYHYHVAMNRFKARVPLVGFAQARSPLPDTAVRLLGHTLAGRDAWLVTVGLPPTAPDNEVEHWLALNAFQATDDWIGDARLVRYATPLPAATAAVQATLGSEVRLLSADVPSSAQRGRAMPIELVWEPLVSPDADYRIFVQLLGADGLPVAQHEGPPLGGYAPTSAWSAGVTVRDRHGLVLPADLPPGVYRLVAGIVEPASGRRLLDAQGDSFVELGAVTVESGGG